MKPSVNQSQYTIFFTKLKYVDLQNLHSLTNACNNVNFVYNCTKFPFAKHLGQMAEIWVTLHDKQFNFLNLTGIWLAQEYKRIVERPKIEIAS